MFRYNNKTYKIDDIDWNSKPSHTFSYRDGEISYADYYKKMYEMDVQDMEQPLLVSNPKKRVCFCLTPRVIFVAHNLFVK